MTDHALARHNMVESQIRTNKVTDPAIVAAFEAVPRELFVPKRLAGIAYVDEDLPIGNGRHIMEPMVLARLLQIAQAGPDDIVLDIGCATGYSTAVLAKIAATVIGLESDADLVATATESLERLEIDNAAVVEGALEAGYPKQAPYDLIIMSGAVGVVPQAILDQLSDRGRLVAVFRDSPEAQGRAVLMERVGGTVSRRVAFDAATPLLPGFQKEPGFVF